MKKRLTISFILFSSREVASFSNKDISSKLALEKTLRSRIDKVVEHDHDEDLLTWHFLTPGGRHHHYADKVIKKQIEQHTDHVIPASLLPAIAKKRRNKLGITFDNDATTNENDDGTHDDASQQQHMTFRELIYPDGIFPVSLSEEDVILQEKLLHAWGLSQPLVSRDTLPKTFLGQPADDLLP